ncbi:MAG: sel1 repeat family protein, partial [Proteobacteria bacterium]|nr:sel1 repeat family protein [Pseudomonadota bacterium]
MAIDTAKLKDLLQKLISRRWNQESFKLLLFEIENLSEEEETFFLNTVRDASIGYLVSFCSGFTKIKELQPSTRYSLVDKFDAMFVQKHQEVNLALVISPNGEQKIFKNPTLIFLEHPENKLACAYLGKVYLDGIPSTVEPNFNKAMELFKNRFNHIDSESAFKILLKNQKLEGPFLSSDEASILSNKIKRLSKPTLAYILDIIKQSWEKDEYPIWFVIANLKQHLSPKTCPLIEEFNVIFDQKFQELVDAYIKTPEDPISAKNVISQKIKIYFDNLQISEEKQNRILALSTNDVSDTEKSNILTLQGEVYLHQKKYDSAIQSLQSAIALKHSGAMSTRAHMHIHGLGGEKNYSEAFSHLDNAMELGNAVAINGRGYMYEQGLGGEKNYAKAIERFEKAADLRNPNAMYNRAHMHANALGGERNYSKAIELSEKSIPLGNTSAMTLRACMHMQGFGGDKNYAKAIVLFEKAILLENAYAMAFRAYMHMQGFGGDKNYAKAIELLEKAILLGNSKALYYRALMYINGWGSEKNLQKASELCFQTTLKGDKEALKMLTSLAEKDPDACFYLGKVYFLGSPEPNLIKPEFEKAVTLFKKSFNLTDDPEIAFKILLEDQKLEGPFLSSDEAKILLNKIANLSETKLSPIINIIEQSWGKDEYPIWFAIANLKQHVSPKTCPLIEKFHSIFDQKFQELVDIYIKTPEDPISEKNTLSQKIEIYFENHQISEEQQKRILALSTHDVLEPEKSNILTLQGKVYLHQKKYDFAIKTLQPAIELKHSSAMSTRARMHIFGLGGDKNYAAAIILLNDPILSSNPAAINSRGYMYEHGLGGDKNYDKAIERFEKAADLGDSNAIYNRAYIHANALGGKRNYSKAIELSEKAILLGDSNAIILRALMYIYGLGGDKNYPKAIALLKKAILLGNSSAMYYLALMYINGWGSEKDLKKATELCFRAALNGNKDALEKLTYLAEKEKDPHACFYLGKVYLLGVPNLIEADLFKAMESFKKNLDLIDSETAFRILLENKKLKTPILSSDEAENLSNKLKDLWETQLNPIRNIIKQSWEQHENSILSLIKNLKQLSYFKPSFTSTFDKLFNFFDNIFNQILEKLIKAYIEKQEEPTLKKILTYFDDDLISAKQVSQIFYLPIDTYEGVLKSNILYLQGKVCLHLSKKYPEAIKCFSQAISLGNSKAMNDLAMMYEKGRASPSRTKDIQAAAELYFQAFIKGYEEALQNLGRLQQENKEHAHVCFYLGEAYLFNKSAVKPVQEWYKIIFYLQ